MKKVKLYRINEALLEAVRGICEPMGIAVSAFRDEDLSLPVHTLFETETEAGICRRFQNSYFLMRNVSNDELLSVLSRMEEQGFPFDGIKVHETVYNKNWTVADLMEETEKEKRLFSYRDELRDLLMEVNSLPLGTLNTEVREQLKSDCLAALTVLQSRENSEEELVGLIENLNRDMERFGLRN